jgi:hypothetical protein
MKRDHVVPDLLASMTADALFDPRPKVPAGQPAGPKRGPIWSPGRWFRAAPASLAATVGPPAPRTTLDDDWVGGWYARTRLLQATALAHGQTRAKTGSTGEAGDATGILADVVSQVKDCS